MGGGLAQAMFTKVADKFYDLVVRSDVGIIDVSWGLKDQKTSAVTQLTNQKNLELKAARRGLPQGAGGGQVTRRARALLPWTLAMLALAPACCAASRGGPPAAPAPPADLRRRWPPDSALLDEMEKDVQHFAQMVTEYRAHRARDPEARLSATRRRRSTPSTTRRSTSTISEARERRRDAIAMFEAFLLKYPNDKRWTPDAMFRLAELYYEKSAEEYLDADEAYKKALDTPNPPDTPPPRVDYTPTINLYRRLLTEFPSYRFLDAAYYLLGFCLGEMGEDAAGQAGAARAGLLEPVQAARSRRSPTPKPPPRAPGAAARRRRGVLQGVHAGPEGVEVHPRGVDAHRRVPLRQPERAASSRSRRSARC